ncbi:toll/interleukin-1 receptor domain-containing protein [Actinoplanes sp. Pm04-4]|uniref:Toll/interleukin-1 receptor domain-containing protein n=1 Tax=Paractinoplanes pyxinae TaxID=2997416 RepID=A0ABT4B9Y3_9ACTN|nr:toll/interleukin-1 receptor domain-containing protein [Actinoplanes pyxinae]MCY1142438.1 toll/interleukin-1 receptor domain-containing protein [Actinoplanes pyxinae]
MTDVFISYRTSDEPMTAVFIKHVLGNRIGDQRVFLDNTSIPLGTHFPPTIEKALDDCQALVAVIGVRWLEADQNGRRRVDDPSDWVRREIIHVLGRGIPVIPVLIGDVHLDQVALPTELAALSSRQFLPVRVRSVEHDLRPLMDRLSDLVDPPGADGATTSATVSNVFNDTVYAPNGVFGISNN